MFLIINKTGQQLLYFGEAALYVIIIMIKSSSIPFHSINIFLYIWVWFLGCCACYLSGVRGFPAETKDEGRVKRL